MMIALLLALVSGAALALSFKFRRELRSSGAASLPSGLWPGPEFISLFGAAQRSRLAALLPVGVLCLLLWGFSFALWFVFGALIVILSWLLDQANRTECTRALEAKLRENDSTAVRRMVFFGSAYSFLSTIALAGLSSAALYLYAAIPSVVPLLSAYSLGAALTLWLISAYPAAPGVSLPSKEQLLFVLYPLAMSALTSIGSNLELFLPGQREWFMISGLAALLIGQCGLIMCYRAFEELEELNAVDATRSAALLQVGVCLVLTFLYALFFSGVLLWHWLIVFVLTLFTFALLPLSARVEAALGAQACAAFLKRLEHVFPAVVCLLAAAMSVFLADRVDSAYCLVFAGLSAFILLPGLCPFGISADLAQRTTQELSSTQNAKELQTLLEQVLQKLDTSRQLSKLYFHALVSLVLLCIVAAQLWVAFDLPSQSVGSLGGKGVLCGLGASAAYFAWALQSFARRLINQVELVARPRLVMLGVLTLAILFPVIVLYWAGAWLKIGFLAGVFAQASSSSYEHDEAPEGLSALAYGALLLALGGVL